MIETYLCDYCDNAAFCSDSSLKAHIVLKHPEKCQHCQKCRGRLAKKMFSDLIIIWKNTSFASNVKSSFLINRMLLTICVSSMEKT